jgi:hypothetical protein
MSRFDKKTRSKKKLRAIGGQFDQWDVKRTEIDTIGIQKLES